jgi:asparagine synthetase B (glutamine-hydrolysing)
MPTLAGWLTDEQISQEIIEQALTAMGHVLALHGGLPARSVQAGAGLLAFSDPAYTMHQNHNPPVLDWVPDRRTFVYRRPLSGLHALYYIVDWPTPGNLLFASEIKALLAVGVPRRLRLAALDALLRYGFIPAPWTAFKDIHVVPAGSLLRWQRGTTIVNHATDYHLDQRLSGTNALNQVYELLDEVVAHILPPHEQLIALTGGDSSSALSVALAARHTTTPFSIASISYQQSLSSQIWRNAECVADACQRPLLAITGVDRPEFWTATLIGLEAPTVTTRPLVLHQLLHTAAAETGARVAISGLGAHLLLGTMIKQTAPDTRPRDMLNWYSQTLSQPLQKKRSDLWSQDAAALLQDEERWEETLHARKLARQAAKFADQQEGWYYLDLHLRLPDSVVNTVQQLATQERMVVRSPYLNARVIDTLTRLPLTFEDGRAKSTLPSVLLRRSISAEVTERSTLPLNGPVTSLLRVATTDLLQQTLAPAAIRARGIFDTQAVEELLNGKMDNVSQQKLLLVFTTQLLCQLFGLSL